MTLAEYLFEIMYEHFDASSAIFTNALNLSELISRDSSV